ncbi:prepilin peptidase [Cryobacterium sp. AP23]
MSGAGSLALTLAIVSAVLGLLIGSFLNVVVYRVPAGISISSPPSACPRCNSSIKARDNVPVLSWLLLRGKCRNCRSAISTRYPLVEFGTAVFFGLVTWSYLAGKISGAWAAPLDSVPQALVLIALLYLGAASVALALIDVDTHRLPNSIVYPSYVVGAILLGGASILDQNFEALVGAAVGMGAMWLAYLVMALAYPGGMGFGDVKLAGLLGLFLGYLGWAELVVGAFAAFLLGGFFAVGLILLRRASRKSGIPFGPWMLAGAWVGILFGASVWDGYLTLLGVK